MQLQDDGALGSRAALARAALAESGILTKLGGQLRIREIAFARGPDDGTTVKDRGWDQATDIAVSDWLTISLDQGAEPLARQEVFAAHNDARETLENARQQVEQAAWTMDARRDELRKGEPKESARAELRQLPIYQCDETVDEEDPG